jgi:hypothetical protein
VKVASPLPIGNVVPTNGEAPVNPVASEPVHVSEVDPTDSVPGPPEAVNAVSPEFSQVTASAADDIAAKSDASAVTKTTTRMILLMVFS